MAPNEYFINREYRLFLNDRIQKFFIVTPISIILKIEFR